MVHKLWPRLTFLSTDDDNNKVQEVGAMTIFLQTFMLEQTKKEKYYTNPQK